jgi:hypothetical protein
MNTQLTYNQTYAYRLPPTLIDQARALADFHEDGVFSDAEANGIGNGGVHFPLPPHRRTDQPTAHIIFFLDSGRPNAPSHHLELP